MSIKFNDVHSLKRIIIKTLLIKEKCALLSIANCKLYSAKIKTNAFYYSDIEGELTLIYDTIQKRFKFRLYDLYNFYILLEIDLPDKFKAFYSYNKPTFHHYRISEGYFGFLFPNASQAEKFITTIQKLQTELKETIATNFLNSLKSKGSNQSNFKNLHKALISNSKSKEGKIPSNKKIHFNFFNLCNFIRNFTHNGITNRFECYGSKQFALENINKYNIKLKEIDIINSGDVYIGDKNFFANVIAGHIVNDVGIKKTTRHVDKKGIKRKTLKENEEDFWIIPKAENVELKNSFFRSSSSLSTKKVRENTNNNKSNDNGLFAHYEDNNLLLNSLLKESNKRHRCRTYESINSEDKTDYVNKEKNIDIKDELRKKLEDKNYIKLNKINKNEKEKVRELKKKNEESDDIISKGVITPNKNDSSMKRKETTKSSKSDYTRDSSKLFYKKPSNEILKYSNIEKKDNVKQLDHKDSLENISKGIIKTNKNNVSSKENTNDNRDSTIIMKKKSREKVDFFVNTQPKAKPKLTEDKNKNSLDIISKGIIKPNRLPMRKDTSKSVKKDSKQMDILDSFTEPKETVKQIEHKDSLDIISKGLNKSKTRGIITKNDNNESKDSSISVNKKQSNKEFKENFRLTEYRPEESINNTSSKGITMTKPNKFDNSPRKIDIALKKKDSSSKNVKNDSKIITIINKRQSDKFQKDSNIESKDKPKQTEDKKEEPVISKGLNKLNKIDISPIKKEYDSKFLNKKTTIKSQKEPITEPKDPKVNFFAKLGIKREGNFDFSKFDKPKQKKPESIDLECVIKGLKKVGAKNFE